MAAVVTKLRLSERYRWWAAGVGMFGIATFVGIVVDPEAYDAPIFATVRVILPLTGWAVAWGAIGVVALVAALVRSARCWRMASIASVAAALVWLTGISWEHWIDGTRLTLTGWALWAWFAGSNIMGATSRHQFDVWIEKEGR